MLIKVTFRATKKAKSTSRTILLNSRIKMNGLSYHLTEKSKNISNIWGTYLISKLSVCV